MRRDVHASNMHDGRWMFTRTTGEPATTDGTPCEIIGIRDYRAYEIVKIVEWMAERAAGYPKLDLPWPRSSQLFSCHEGAVWPHKIGPRYPLPDIDMVLTEAEADYLHRVIGR